MKKNKHMAPASYPESQANLLLGFMLWVHLFFMYVFIFLV